MILHLFFFLVRGGGNIWDIEIMYEKLYNLCVNFSLASMVDRVILQIKFGWTEAAMIAGAREAGVSPAIVGSFTRKEAALVEVE